MFHINPKYTLVVMATIMSFIMSIVISLALTLLDLGVNMHAFGEWPLEWIKSWAVALPVAILVLPQVRKMATALTK